MQYLSVALPLAALVSGAFAAPNPAAPVDDACLAAVTGKAALGDGGLRAFHCKSFLATTVTPPAITETVTITGEGGKNGWKRGVSVTVCPNEVPNYASACDEAHYTSACSVFGYTEVKTTTIAPTTTTKTVFVRPTGGVVVSGTTCPAASTVTKTVSGSGWAGDKETVTVTVGSGSATVITKTVTVTGTHSVPDYTTVTTTTAVYTTTSSVPSKCVVSDAKATEIVNNFITLLEYTSYEPAPGSPIPKGRGYKKEVSDATLATNFTDISDSINFMAGFALGSVTFASKAAFDYGQGVLQPEVAVKTLNIWHTCNTITWRWSIYSTAFPVVGINHFIVGEDGLVIKNYAEFDNGAWLQSFGRQCAINNVSNSGSNALKARSVDAGLMNLRNFN